MPKPLVTRDELREMINTPQRLINLPLFGSAPKTKAEEVVDKVGQNNYNRIQKNVQQLVDAGAPITDINKYLGEIEGVPLDIDPEYLPGRKPTTIKSIADQTTRGGFIGVGGLGALVALGFDMATTAVEQAGWLITGGIGIGNIGDPNAKAGFDPATIPRFKGTAINAQQEGWRQLEETIFGERPDPATLGVVDRTAGKIGEFVVPGALAVRGMTTAGARLATAWPEGAGWWRNQMIKIADDPVHAMAIQSGMGKSFSARVLQDISRNPGRAQALEAATGATSATLGELGVNAATGGFPGSDPDTESMIRLVGEMSGVFGFAGAIGFSNIIGNVAKSKLILGEAHKQKIAEEAVGKFFNMLMELDPNLRQEFRIAQELSERTGVQFTTAQVLNNPNVQATLQRVISSNSEAATRFQKLLMQAQIDTGKFVDSVKPILTGTERDIQHTLGGMIDRRLAAIDSSVEKVLRNSADEIRLLKPNASDIEIAESAYEELNTLYQADIKAVDAIYDLLPNPENYPIKHIKFGITKAKASSAELAEIEKAVKEGRKPAKALEFKRVPKPVQDLLDTAEANFGTKIRIDASGKEVREEVKSASLLAIREFRYEVNEAIRQAARSHDNESVRRLMHVRKGIDKQILVHTRGLKGQARKTFIDANRLYEEVVNKYDRSFAAAMHQGDMSRADLDPGDFLRFWVRPSSGANARKLAKDYRRAFGDSAYSKMFITDSVSWELNKMLDGRDLTPSVFKEVEGWLRKHKDVLKAHGVWDSFNTVSKASRRATEMVAMGKQNRLKFEKDEFRRVVGLARTDDLNKYIQQHLQGNTLHKLKKEVDAMKSEPAMRAFKRLVFDNILETAETSTLIGTSTPGNIDVFRKNPGQFIKTLIDHKKTLVGALGREHYEDLRTLGNVWARQFGDPIAIKGGKAPLEATLHEVTQRTMGRVLSKIRASMQGFVSPEFTAVQLANQFLDIMNAGTANRVFLDALTDPKVAQVLSKEAATAAGQDFLYYMGVLMIPPAIALESKASD